MFLSHRQQTGKTFNRLWEIYDGLLHTIKKYFILALREFRTDLKATVYQIPVKCRNVDYWE